MSAIPTFKLNDGNSIPWIVWGIRPDQRKVATDAGLRAVDTAQQYGTEPDTGKLVAEAAAAGIDRSEWFITSKLSFGPNDSMLPMDQVRPSIEKSIETMGLVPDLFLIHNPFVVPDIVATWKILEEMKDEGKLKSIGVSNFRVQDYEKIMASNPKYLPTVNQIEYHPFVLTHLAPVLEFQAKHGIVTESFGPLTPLLRHPTKGGPLVPVLERIAARLTSSTGKPVDTHTVLLLWTRAQGVVAVTSSGNPENIRKLGETAVLGDLLEPGEIEEITAVGKKHHFRHYKEHMTEDFPEPDLPNGA